MYVLLALFLFAYVGDARSESFCKVDNQPWVQYCFEPGSFYGLRRCNSYEPEDVILRPGCTVHNPSSNHTFTSKRCVDGRWEDVLTCTPEYRRIPEHNELVDCKLDTHPSVAYTCRSVNSKATRRCNSTEPPGTIIQSVCNEPHYFSISPLPPMKCTDDGRWDNVVTCKPVKIKAFMEAKPCDESQCLLPNCFCSENGTTIPGGLPAASIPQMITLTFDGVINKRNMKLYNKIFNGERKNPNGCGIKATFFVSHKHTNYSVVHEMHGRGHEIAAHSITHNVNEGYWRDATVELWAKEMAGVRAIIEKFANISGNSVVGMRAPHLRVGGHSQFSMIEQQGFLYDSSITAPLSNPPLWPYTVHYQLPHLCQKDRQRCPTGSYEAWEMVLNELDPREDPQKSEDMPGCGTPASCEITDGFHFYEILKNNFKRHYNQNRAPFGIHLNNEWVQKYEFQHALINWIDYVLGMHNDVYFVTMRQVLKWMETPGNVNSAKKFEAWKVNCEAESVLESGCESPRSCELTARELPAEAFTLQTCAKCPTFYPWLKDPTGNGR